MIELPIERPSNQFLVRERDHRWLPALAATLMLAMLLGSLLFLVGWPRLQATSIHYDLIRLRAQVEELERQHRELEVTVERARSPELLARRAQRLGLQPPDPSQLRVVLPGGGS